jgi:acetate kinase
MSSSPSIPTTCRGRSARCRHMLRGRNSTRLPRALADAGLLSLGIHGLSYEYTIRELGVIDRAAADGRVIIAHLGNGAHGRGAR